MAIDPENADANYQGTMLEAVTKDQLNTGLKGQIRWHVSERNLYAYLFGVKHPIVHVMGYFVSVLRERIANFEAPAGAPRPATPTRCTISPPPPSPAFPSTTSAKTCPTSTTTWTRNAPGPPRATASRWTPRSSPALTRRRRSSPRWPPSTPLTTRFPPASASRRPRADQKIVQSKRAVEIETLKAQAEVQPHRRAGRPVDRLEDRTAPARSTPMCATCG